MKLDILAIGAHPDDVELGCSGTIINEIRNGRKAGIIDLTKGELGTRGNAKTRIEESKTAANILGVAVRDNLNMKDGFFQNDPDHQIQVIRAIRKFNPEIILANAPEDRHPDHGRASKLVSDSAFFSGLVKIETVDDDGKMQEPWRPKYVFHYIQDRLLEPSFVIDITEVFEQRMDAIKCYASQFFNKKMNEDEPQSYISSPEFFESLIARARMMGKRIGVKYGEGFISEKGIGFKNFNALIQVVT